MGSAHAQGYPTFQTLSPCFTPPASKNAILFFIKKGNVVQRSFVARSRSRKHRTVETQQ